MSGLHSKIAKKITISTFPSQTGFIDLYLNVNVCSYVNIKYYIIFIQKIQSKIINYFFKISFGKIFMYIKI